MSDEIDEMLSQESEQESVSEQPEAEAPEAPEEAQAEAPAEVEEEPQVEPEAKEKAEPMVPLSVLKSTREDLRQQLDEMRRMIGSPKQEQPAAPPPPDVFEDPQKYTQYIGQQVQQSVIGAKLEMSRWQAEREFGKEALEEVVQYFDQNPAQSQQFLSAPSPYHAAKEFYDAQKTAQEIGNDPAAYKAKLEAEIRAKVEAEMAAKQASQMAAKPAPSLAGVNGSGGNTDPGWQGPTDLGSVIGE